MVKLILGFPSGQAVSGKAIALLESDNSRFSQWIEVSAAGTGIISQVFKTILQAFDIITCFTRM